MAKQLMILLGIAVMMALLSGCGYKAPPYYENKSPSEEKPVAL